MVSMESSGGMSQQPCYSSYINLRNVGMSNGSSSYGPSPASEDPLGYKVPVMRRSRFVFSCKHFPEVEVSKMAHWACEFCDGAELIEQASRSNEAVSSLDIDKLLCNYNTTCSESVSEANCASNAVNSTYNKMGTWILRTKGRDTPGN
ncbi:hypothetical protein M758_8G013200 [Ceratodon purpureus]|uniref:Uncharacterized protein n=1 Tax=Ceratodon purpureus TaxID=3225 RepID=A0A8T0GYA6_CERPU|nr:hypothetical protein KC19_8G014000 [Ceratodon purpureus]KAG0607250.1 hypothetical protein M758_8G013200 [Ceratodon purpureus]